MKIVDSYFTHEDERGFIRGIINDGNWQEINYISSKKGVERANHYHKDLKELFIIIEGKIRITYFKVNDRNKIETKIVKKGDVFLFEKNLFHRFEVIKDAIWINVLSKKIDPKNPDIHRLE